MLQPFNQYNFWRSKPTLDQKGLDQYVLFFDTKNLCKTFSTALHEHYSNPWLFQDPKLELPTIYKLYKAYFLGLFFRPMVQGISPHMAKQMVLTYLLFRILQFPSKRCCHTIFRILWLIYVGEKGIWQQKR